MDNVNHDLNKWKKADAEVIRHCILVALVKDVDSAPLETLTLDDVKDIVKKKK